MITRKEFFAKRDYEIYIRFYIAGSKQRMLARIYGLSVSRVKAICQEQKKKMK